MTVKIIKAAAGLGKTSRLIEKLKNSPYKKVEIYVPTHELGGQIAASFAPAVQNVVIRGRSYVEGDAPMCMRHREAEMLVEKGHPVYPVLCAKRVDHGRIEHCEHYQNCRYIAQFTRDAQVYIYTHASLPLERGILDEGFPELAVIDESFFNSCLDRFEVSKDDLESISRGIQTRAICSALYSGLESGKPLLSELGSQISGQSLELALDENKPTLPHFSPYWNDKKQLSAIKGLAIRPRIRELLETLQVELAAGRSVSHAFTLNHQQRAVRVHRRLPITRFGKGSDVVMLDADADPLIVRQWFPDATVVPIPAGRNAYVVQCTSTRCSTTSLVPERNADPKSKAYAERRLKDVQALIERKAKAGKKVLVVGPQAITGNAAQDLPALIKVPAGSELAHFGAIRGVDRWKNFDAAIVVGRNQPPIKGAEEVARAIWFDDPSPLDFAEEWEVEERPYRVRPGVPPLGVEVLVHPDKRVQAVVEQIRERESAQAIDRLRLIHATSPKDVVLLSNVPLEIEVDAFLPWDEIVYGTRLERAWATLRGVMPLSPGWLAKRFPELWASEDAAEADVRGLSKNREFTNRVSIRNPTVLTVHFRAAGQKRHSWAISTLPLGQTHVQLSGLMLGVPLLVAEVRDGMRLLEGGIAVGGVTLPPRGAEGKP